MGLTRYQQKRNFARTSEPAGDRIRQGSTRELSFVIQKHAARRLHYDFRLEMEGVLKSWAVPKGIPVKRADKRLAMHVEDHPLEYGGFEGIIAPGNYGAGSVMIWDTGRYESLEGDVGRAFKKGKLVFHLEGKKLKGEWTLVQMKGRQEGAKDPWLLIKTGEDHKPISARAEDSSALSSRSMKQIAEKAESVWQSNRSAVKSPRFSTRTRRSRSRLNSSELKQLANEAPQYVSPMKALSKKELPRREGWLFEVKLDGIRAITVKNGAEIHLFSRRPREITKDFPDIVETLKALPFEQLVLDGEIVALDSKGRSSFQLLQNIKRGEQPGIPIRYYLFDILNLEGRDLKNLPLTRRKELLESMVAEIGEPIRFSASLESEPEVLWKEIQRLGLEGVIAKQKSSKYEPDRRSGAWAKIKLHRQQEFVIGGYTAPAGTRQYFGSLLVGYYENDKLLFASRVGSGFDTELLRSLHKAFQPLRQSDCPFANLPAPRGGRWGQGLTGSVMKKCTWIEPKFVCQARYMEWTRDGGLRHPVFLGLREDKNPREVSREVEVE